MTCSARSGSPASWRNGPCSSSSTATERRKRCGVAERGWHELAGADAEVTDLEAVIRRLDPQHEDAHLVASETVGVKATDVVLHQFRQRWLAFWRELGLPAPDPAHGEQAVGRAGRARRSSDRARGTGRRSGGWTLARVVSPAAPVVVLEGPEELRQLSRRRSAEGLAAAAGALGVGVLDGEPGALEAVLVVERGALRGARRSTASTTTRTPA